MCIIMSVALSIANMSTEANPDTQQEEDLDAPEQEEQADKQNNNQSATTTQPGKNGGARPGAGRPKGSLSKAARERREAEQYIRDRVIAAKSVLVNAQMSLAQGTQMLFVIHTETINGKKVRGRPEIVTDPDIIASYLAEELDDEDDDYYFMTTERPDNRALDSLMDRSFGKAKQPIELDADLRTHNINLDVDASDDEQAAVKAALLGSIQGDGGEA